MRNPNDKKPQINVTVRLCMLVCVVLGVSCFEVVSGYWFPRRPGEGINVERVLYAALVGGVCAAIGAGIGKLIDNLRK